jgi:hypothetical protein
MLRKIVVLMFAFMVVGAADARATLRIISANDPAGDPTRIHYRISSPTWSSSPIDFDLIDGDYRSFGVAAGTYTIEAFPPEGWYVGDIQCVPAGSSAFATDVANRRVVVTHGAEDHHFCTFTNRKGTPGSAPSPGISPAPPRSLVPPSLLSRHPALVRVRAGHGYAEASIRVTQHSIIKGWLLRHKKVIVGNKRVEHDPGTRVLRVKLQRKRMRRMQRRGLEHVRLLLRIAVTAPNGATHVFKHRVLIDLT